MKEARNMQIRKRCFFIGHRVVNHNIYERLCKEIEQLIVQYGVSEFWVGHYGEFDELVTRCLAQIKNRYPFIHLVLLGAYTSNKYKKQLPVGFDNMLYPFDGKAIYWRSAIPKTNEYAIDHCNFLITYVWHDGSNASKFLAYARKKEAKKNDFHIILLV